jgi:hypothetical protein
MFKNVQYLVIWLWGQCKADTRTWQDDAVVYARKVMVHAQGEFHANSRGETRLTNASTKSVQHVGFMIQYVQFCSICSQFECHANKQPRSKKPRKVFECFRLTIEYGQYPVLGLWAQLRMTRRDACIAVRLCAAEKEEHKQGESSPILHSFPVVGLSS